MQGINTTNEDVQVFYGNGGPLVCYYNVSTLEDVAVVGKGQVVLEGREQVQHECPGGRDIAAGRPARNGRHTHTHTHPEALPHTFMV